MYYFRQHKQGWRVYSDKVMSSEGYTISFGRSHNSQEVNGRYYLDPLKTPYRQQMTMIP